MANGTEKNKDKCGLVNIDNTRGMFALFYDETGTMGYKRNYTE